MESNKTTIKVSENFYWNKLHLFPKESLKVVMAQGETKSTIGGFNIIIDKKLPNDTIIVE